MLLNQSVWQGSSNDLNRQTSINLDDCEVDSRDRYNDSQAKYTLLNFADNEIAAVIGDDSNLRYGVLGNLQTAPHHKYEKIPVCTAPLSLTSPYMGAGSAGSTIPDQEPRAETTSKRKTCNGISGLAINRFVPLIPELQDSIQDPRHLIESGWIRGGMHTRMTIRNADYLKSCGIKGQ